MSALEAGVTQMQVLGGKRPVRNKWNLAKPAGID